ncbi:hypothetical protein TTHERM_00655540 (macronuclear) [Tetrahymena thermophila SB210]|uniref:Uncharacterized protein n=1 Tax=Tetrahymena thermophila (strain SB210) TaxID=312017 RepID=Q22GZ8_TETTS|nr:hypothetical protein TTHERM_00655540 [Tetrahymena thermophila SB210]EAR84526.1 hypothetical protein TTHERM_00655540 [Tetrahymena thermophila SB210]|eukprot:XP_001032189.1 hypothetical protein TTHERM_00655540 [Tetrahymena thermophila SB210]
MKTKQIQTERSQQVKAKAQINETERGQKPTKNQNVLTEYQYDEDLPQDHQKESLIKLFFCPDQTFRQSMNMTSNANNFLDSSYITHLDMNTILQSPRNKLKNIYKQKLDLDTSINFHNNRNSGLTSSQNFGGLNQSITTQYPSQGGCFVSFDSLQKTNQL